MKNTTEDRIRRIQKWCWIVAALIVVSGVTVVYMTPSLRYDEIAFDQEEVDSRTKEVRERAEAMRKEREKELAERRLSEQHARELTEQAEKKEREEIVRKLKNVSEVYEKLDEENRRRTERIQKRSLTERLHKKSAPLRQNMQRTLDLVKRVEEIDEAEDKKVPEGFTESLQADRDKLKALLDQLQEGFDEAALPEIAKTAESIEAKARAVEEPEEKPFNDRRRQMIWASSDTSRDAKKLMAEAQAMADAEAEAAAQKASNRDQAASLPESVKEAIANPDEKSVGELYDAAQTLEENLNAMLDEARAAELARRQGSSLPEARSKLTPSTSQLEEIPALHTPELPRTIGELNERREAIAKAAQQVSRLDQRATEASQQLSPADSERASAISTSASLNQALQNSLNQAAQQGQRGKISDMSGLMRLAMNQGGGDTGDSGERERRNLEGTLDSGETSQKDQTLDLRRVDVAANALPGRRFSESSARQGWLYLDTWYLIGPWDNHGDLRSFEIPHPPENEIDFDGAYEGKVYTSQHARQDAAQGIDRGYTVNQPRTLRWDFVQFDSVRMDIPDEASDATYYLFTDVYFEEARDMLIAIGSDDAAKVWINGIVVWLDESQSQWELGEHFSKVYFKQGYNSILVRLENGPVQCELSFLICPPVI